MKIPKGWRKLRKGTVIKEGDMFYLFYAWSETRWPGDTVKDATYIRKIKKRSISSRKKVK